jgi:hypothetical protein
MPEGSLQSPPYMRLQHSEQIISLMGDKPIVLAVIHVLHALLGAMRTAM